MRTPLNATQLTTWMLVNTATCRVWIGQVIQCQCMDLTHILSLTAVVGYMVVMFSYLNYLWCRIKWCRKKRFLVIFHQNVHFDDIQIFSVNSCSISSVYCVATADFSEECEWQAVKENRYISGNDLKTLTGMTPDTCRQACENEQTFRCMSFDFLKTNNYCYLQRVNLYRVAVSNHANYDYYERTCKSK